MEYIRRYFGFKEHNTSFMIEVRAGFTTFLTVAYILFVNPSILSSAIPIEHQAFPQMMTATALAAAFGCLVMGFFARLPFALAPGMGLNAYFAYTVVGSLGVPWQSALGAIFISGLIFSIISAFGIRSLLVEAIPHSVKVSSAAGIGLFLALIGAKNSGIVVDHPATLLTMGDLSQAGPALAAVGLMVMAVLTALRIRGAILIGILTISFAAIVFELPVFQGKAYSSLEQGLIQSPVWPVDLVASLDFQGAWELGIFGVVFVFFFVDFFDTAGTFLGLSQKIDMFKGGDKSKKAFLSDAIATMVGAVIGTTTTTTYVESAAGIEEGGRSGLVAVVCGCLFLLSIFLWPIASMVPAIAIAPALILVGAMMMGGLSQLNWNDPTISVPAFLTIMTMPFTFSIANGISVGIISHVIIFTFVNRAREVNWIVFALAAALIARFIYLSA